MRMRLEYREPDPLRKQPCRGGDEAHDTAAKVNAGIAVNDLSRAPLNSSEHADAWVARLPLATLPVLAASKSALVELGRRPTLSAPRIGELAFRDPLFAFHLLRAAGELDHHGRAPDTASLAHAVMLLGMERTLALGARLSSIEDLRPKARLAGLLRTILRACHAAALARAWAATRQDPQPDVIACAAMMRCLAELAIRASLDESPELFAQIAQASGDSDSAECEVLGTDLATLSGAIARHSKIPRMVSDAADDTGALQPRLAVAVLAAHIAKSAESGWSKPRMKDLVVLAAELLGTSPDAAGALLASTTAGIARSLPYGSMFTAARSLPLIDDAGLAYADLAVKPMPPAPAPAVSVPRPESVVVPDFPAVPEPLRQAAASTTKTSDKGLAAESGFKRCVALLQPLRRGETQVRDTLPAFMDSLRAALGAERAVFALLSRDRKMLEGRYTCGAPAEPVFSIGLDSRSLVTRLLDGQQGLWLNQSNREQLWRGLPRSLRAYVGERACCVMSVTVAQRSIGLAYVDYVESAREPSVDEREFHLFKRVVTGLSEALEGNRKSTAKPPSDRP